MSTTTGQRVLEGTERMILRKSKRIFFINEPLKLRILRPVDQRLEPVMRKMQTCAAAGPRAGKKSILFTLKERGGPVGGALAPKQAVGRREGVERGTQGDSAHRRKDDLSEVGEEGRMNAVCLLNSKWDWDPFSFLAIFAL